MDVEAQTPVEPDGAVVVVLDLQVDEVEPVPARLLGEPRREVGGQTTTAVWTDPAYRGRGLASHLTAQLADHARRDGIHLIHLQVEHDNEGAVRLYRRLGFAIHSSYAYLTAQQTR